MKHEISRMCLALACVSFIGCGDGSKTNDFPEIIQGTWQSEGYGHVINVEGQSVQLFDITDKTCLKNEESSEILKMFLTQADRMNLRSAEAGNAIFVSDRFEPHETKYNQLNNIPDMCLLTTSADPLANFERFVDLFEYHYPFFHLYDVDWQARVAEARNSVTADMSESELFDVLVELISPLKDSHVGLVAEIDGEEISFEPEPGKTSRAITAKAKRLKQPRRDVSRQTLQSWRAGIDDSLLGGAGTVAGNGFIRYGRISENIGYLSIMTEFGYANGDVLDEAADLAVLNTVLDEAIGSFNASAVNAVIIDLSVNFGGHDFLSRAIAERFAAEQTLAYTKYAGDTGASSPLNSELILHPSQGERFTGPVYVLTSNGTVSAGEILTMSLRALPNVTHVGEATRGALSDVLSKTLPNGWQVELSNEVYTDSDGIVWESKGIEPHVFIANFNAENPMSTHLETVGNVVDLIEP